jgi:hypothetical protein
LLSEMGKMIVVVHHVCTSGLHWMEAEI